jgi:hypothetical protein
MSKIVSLKDQEIIELEKQQQIQVSSQSQQYTSAIRLPVVGPSALTPQAPRLPVLRHALETSGALLALQSQGDQDLQPRASLTDGLGLKSSLTRGFDSILRASKGR